jgi:hypothetical protein
MTMPRPSHLRLIDVNDRQRLASPMAGRSGPLLSPLQEQVYRAAPWHPTAPWGRVIDVVGTIFEVVCILAFVFALPVLFFIPWL